MRVFRVFNRLSFSLKLVLEELRSDIFLVLGANTFCFRDAFGFDKLRPLLLVPWCLLINEFLVGRYFGWVPLSKGLSLIEG